MDSSKKPRGASTKIDLAAFERDGFVIIDDVLPLDMFEAAKEACEIAVEKGRREEWPHRRIVGKAFPPWPSSGPDIWGIQHLMHPDLKLPIFKQIYTDPKLLSTACAILSLPSAGNLQLELFNLLINPHTTPFSLPYHRDTIPAATLPEEEAKLLTRPRTGTQYNLALYDDACLIVVPGSHKRPKTDEEITTLKENEKAPLKDEIRVVLKPNQAVFYENDILHRAEYDTKKRVTLHGSLGKEGQVERARMVLQHGVEYLKENSFAEEMGDVGKRMWGNLIDGYGKSIDETNIHDI
ncbi:hypothetical protein TWF569_008914 [Orbilia oligospora]|uniref:Phytanoyl-CoA dioxygenase n=1 Tax=Orbilia oligospora TaxID=2813651 RepID=A0A7C8NHX9_ORBOL|nr:hypothetical protein TWF103_006487 [Orbilia oligospora]KAF3108074.1 hypothetical protein TWF102_011553 [Orbilia oligospora]KAF3155546.1 hypothetical protein TWF569_008914 [Orbilia oligospora]